MKEYPIDTDRTEVDGCAREICKLYLRRLSVSSATLIHAIEVAATIGHLVRADMKRLEPLPNARFEVDLLAIISTWVYLRDKPFKESLNSLSLVDVIVHLKHASMEGRQKVLHDHVCRVQTLVFLELFEIEAKETLYTLLRLAYDFHQTVVILKILNHLGRVYEVALLSLDQVEASQVTGDDDRVAAELVEILSRYIQCSHNNRFQPKEYCVKLIRRILTIWIEKKLSLIELEKNLKNYLARDDGSVVISSLRDILGFNNFHEASEIDKELQKSCQFSGRFLLLLMTYIS